MRPIDVAIALLRPIVRPFVGAGVGLGRRPKILILKPCCIGDVLFATPLVRAVRKAYPDAHLTFGVGPWARAAIASNPHVDAILDTGRVGSGSWSIGDFLDLAARIRANRFDACLVLDRSVWIGLLAAIARIPLRAGLDSGGRGVFHHHPVAVLPGRHEIDLYLEVGKAIGALADDRAIEFHPTADELNRARSLIAELGLDPRRTIALHPAGGSNPGMQLERKRWPALRFAALAAKMQARGFQPVLVGGPSDRAIAEAIRGAAAEPLVSLVGKLSLGETAALIGQLAGYIGGDTGVTHLAAAVGAPVVALFGPSDPGQYAPPGERVVVVQGLVPCGPCFRNGSAPPCSRHVCMERIEVESVWGLVRQSMGGAS